jgi:hypothetical protein
MKKKERVIVFILSKLGNFAKRCSFPFFNIQIFFEVFKAFV